MSAPDSPPKVGIYDRPHWLARPRIWIPAVAAVVAMAVWGLVFR